MVKASRSDLRSANDADLLDALRAHQPLALAEAYHRTVPAAHSVSRRLVSGNDQVETIMTEVYSRLWKSPPTTGPLEGWVRRATFETGIAYLTNTNTAPASVSTSTLIPELPAPDVSFLDTAERAIAELEDDEREALLKAHDRGIPAAQQGQAAAEALVRALLSLAGPESHGSDRSSTAADECGDLTGLGDFCLGLASSSEQAHLEAQLEDRPGCAAQFRAMRRGRRRIEGLPATPDIGHRILVSILTAGVPTAESGGVSLSGTGSVAEPSSSNVAVTDVENAVAEANTATTVAGAEAGTGGVAAAGVGVSGVAAATAGIAGAAAAGVGIANAVTGTEAADAEVSPVDGDLHDGSPTHQLRPEEIAALNAAEAPPLSEPHTPDTPVVPVEGEVAYAADHPGVAAEVPGDAPYTNALDAQPVNVPEAVAPSAGHLETPVSPPETPVSPPEMPVSPPPVAQPHGEQAGNWRPEPGTTAELRLSDILAEEEDDDPFAELDAEQPVPSPGFTTTPNPYADLSNMDAEKAASFGPAETTQTVALPDDEDDELIGGYIEGEEYDDDLPEQQSTGSFLAWLLPALGGALGGLILAIIVFGPPGA